MRDVESLIKALDENEFRMMAVKALGNLKDERAVKPILKMSSKICEYRGDNCVELLSTLWKIGSREAVEHVLCEMMHHIDLNNMLMPIILHRIEVPINSLIGALKGSNANLRKKAAEILQNVTCTDVDIQGLVFYELGRFDEAAQLGGNSIELLAKALEWRSVEDSVVIATSLGKKGDARGVSWLINTLLEIKEAPSHQRSFYSEAIITSLTRILRNNTLGFATENLEAILNLGEIKQQKESDLGKNPLTDEKEWKTYYQVVDCSALKGLANKELLRRKTEIV